MKIGSKISNRTKIIGGTTILLGAATLVCVIKERLGLKQGELVEEVIEDGIENVISEVPVGDVIDF